MEGVVVPSGSLGWLRCASGAHWAKWPPACTCGLDAPHAGAGRGVTHAIRVMQTIPRGVSFFKREKSGLLPDVL